MRVTNCSRNEWRKYFDCVIFCEGKFGGRRTSACAERGGWAASGYSARKLGVCLSVLRDWRPRAGWKGLELVGWEKHSYGSGGYVRGLSFQNIRIILSGPRWSSALHSSTKKIWWAIHWFTVKVFLVLCDKKEESAWSRKLSLNSSFVFQKKSWSKSCTSACWRNAREREAKSPLDLSQWSDMKASASSAM